MIREAKESDKTNFDRVAKHPLQSWRWGEFREETGVKVSRLVQEKKSTVKSSFQITWHKVPKLGWTIGYCPKSEVPDSESLDKMRKVASNAGAMMIKFEPNELNDENGKNKVAQLQKEFRLVSGTPLFTKYTFVLDISKSESELLAKMHQKTRYNMRLAEKKEVEVLEDNSEKGFEDYWKLTEETTRRQKFFAHTRNYHQKMWKAMVKEGTGHLLKAVYQGKVLAAWILLELNGVLYYPYGASSSENREVMASNLMMWEAIKLGKKLGCKKFDMWGSLGPVPDEKDPWFGFHRFKQGYGGDLVEFVGTYDLVIRPFEYQIYRVVEKLRWLWLRLLAYIKRYGGYQTN